MNNREYKLIVLGSSYGGIEALTKLIPALTDITEVPIVVVQHFKASPHSYLAEHLNKLSSANVKEAEEGEEITEKSVFIAPGDYHLLIEEDHCFSISKDDRVEFSRPSIDVLFESAAEVYAESLIAILLTGANKDGANGMQRVHDCGGVCIVQDPKDAIMPTMPQAAIDTVQVDVIAPLDKIADCVESFLTKHVNQWS